MEETNPKWLQEAYLAVIYPTFLFIILIVKKNVEVEHKFDTLKRAMNLSADVIKEA
jgi:hypothetical protein